MIGLTAPFGFVLLLLIAAAATLLILSGVVAYDAIHPPRRTAGYAIAHGLPADPGDRGLEFESWTLDLPRDVKLPVWEIATRGDGTGTGPTAVFVHGWGESRLVMLTRLDPWLDRARRIVLYDRRGHGDATGGNARLGVGEHEDLHALLDRLGDGPFILVGYGTGGAVATAAVADTTAATRIATVESYDPSPDMRSAIENRLRVRGMPTRPLTDLALVWLRLGGIRHRASATAGQGIQK